MSTCHDLEPLVTAWIDGAATSEQRQAVEAHFKGCPRCRQRADAEDSARDLIRTRAPEGLRSDAPLHLKVKCRALCGVTGTAPRRSLTARPIRVSMAAAFVLAIGGVLIYGLTASSTTTLAAQLTLDHMKCFIVTRDPGEPVSPDLVEAQLRERYGWSIDLPGDSEAYQLRLVGGRRCLDGEGTIAHILYRHNGQPLSLFMLPEKVRSSALVDIMGHEAIIWAQNQRTFVLLGSEPRGQLQQIAAYMRAVVK